MHAVYSVAGVGGFNLHIFKLDPLKWLFHVCICMDVIVYTKGHSLYMTLFLTQECIQERDREIKYLKTQLASLQVYTGTNMDSKLICSMFVLSATSSALINDFFMDLIICI